MTQIAWLASVSAVAWLALAQGTDPRREVQNYLTKHRFTADEIAGLEAGDVVARATLAGQEEIGVVAAVKICVPRDRVLDYYGQMISYVDGSVTLGFGRFST